MEFTCLEGAGQSFAATGQPSEVGFKMMNLGVKSKMALLTS